MWSFRSPHVPCFSVATTLVNVSGRFTATALTTRAPGKKIVASRFPQLIPSCYRVGHQPASMQAMPSRRVHAPRPGITKTLRRFTAGPGRRCNVVLYMKLFSSLYKENYWGTLSPQEEGAHTKNGNRMVAVLLLPRDPKRWPRVWPVPAIAARLFGIAHQTEPLAVKTPAGLDPAVPHSPTQRQGT